MRGVYRGLKTLLLRLNLGKKKSRAYSSRDKRKHGDVGAREERTKAMGDEEADESDMVMLRTKRLKHRERRGLTF